MEKYDMGPLVGKGSFGSVLLATRKDDGAEFVMKRLPIQNVTEKEMEAYQNEIRLLSELEHPGIVCYIESFVDRKAMDLVIVMQYCNGGDLATFIKHAKSSKLSEGDIKYYFVQMALALHFMHEKNILHRDLKTGNVFLSNGVGSQNGSAPATLQLGDFGISKVLNGASDLASTCIGTPYFMSPELFKNKAYNHKSDVWALGCILYELTSLKHAFDALNISSLANKVIHGVYPPIATSYSKDLRELIKTMLGVTPSSRPSVKQILLNPFLFKPIKKYIRHILSAAAEQNYRPAHVLNLRNQLERLGAPLNHLFVDLENEKKQGSSAGASTDDPPPSNVILPSKKAKAGVKKQAVASGADLYDDDSSNNKDGAVDRTIIANPRRKGAAAAANANDKDGGADSHPPTARRKPNDKRAGGGEKAPAPGKGDRGHGMAARMTLLEKEHAERLEELKAEEEAKKKLEKDFERLQAIQAAKAKRIEAKRQQLLKQMGGVDSTASTSKESSTSPNSSGSNLPIISGGSNSSIPSVGSSSSNVSSPNGATVAASPISPPPLGNTINLPSLASNGESSRNHSRNPSPSLNPHRMVKAGAAGPPNTSKLPQVQQQQSSAQAPPASMNMRSSSPASFLPVVNTKLSISPAAAASGTDSQSPPGSLVSSPRTGGGGSSGLPRPIRTQSNGAVSDNAASHEAKESNSGGPPPAELKLQLLKRKVGARSQVDSSSAASAVASSSSTISPTDSNNGPASSRRGRPRAIPPTSSSPVPVAVVGGSSADLESALQSEKEELERLRVERTRLEVLLTKMDEEHGLFQPSPRNNGGNGGNGFFPSNNSSNASRQPQKGAKVSSEQTFSSSTVLPAAFDSPLLYKGRTLAGGAAGATPQQPSSGANNSGHPPKILRRHSSHAEVPIAPRPRGAPLVGNVFPSSNNSAAPGGSANVSTKDRILAAKAAKQQAAASEEQARLLQARKEYFGDRMKAEQRTKEFYGNAPQQSSPDPLPVFLQSPTLQSHSLAVPDHAKKRQVSGSPTNVGLSSSPNHYPSTSPHLHPSHSDDEAPLLLYDDSVLDQHLNSDILPSNPSNAAALLSAEEEELSASSLEVEEFQQHLAQYTRRIEHLRSVIEVSSRAGGARPIMDEEDDSDDDEDDEGDDDEDNENSAAEDDTPAPTMPASLEERKKMLAKECVSLVGREIFIATYDFLESIQADPKKWEDDVDDHRKLERLTQIMGAEKVKHWKLIDQLHFVESC